MKLKRLGTLLLTALNWNPKFQFANFTSSFDNPLQE